MPQKPTFGPELNPDLTRQVLPLLNTNAQQGGNGVIIVWQRPLVHVIGIDQARIRAALGNGPAEGSHVEISGVPRIPVHQYVTSP